MKKSLSNTATKRVLTALTAVLALSAHANDSATPTRLILGYAPGGAMDAFTRIVADGLKKHITGPIIVENKPGASARLAISFAKRAAPDGKTILISSAPLFTVFPYTYKNPGYDADKDVIPVAHLADIPLVLSVGAQKSYQTTKDYLDWVRKTPKDSGIGLVTLGGPTHFGVLSLNKAAGIDLIPTAYKGAAPMLTDEIGGTLPAGIDAIASKMELYKAGRIRFLGVSGTKRSTIVPDVPTLLESGAPGFEMASSWYAAFVPAGTSPEMVSKLEKALISVVNDKEVKEKLARLGVEGTGLSKEELRQQIVTQRQVWKPLVESSGFTAE